MFNVTVGLPKTDEMFCILLLWLLSKVLSNLTERYKWITIQIKQSNHSTYELLLLSPEALTWSFSCITNILAHKPNDA